MFKIKIMEFYSDPRFDHLKKNKVLYGSILATVAALGTAYGIYASLKARRSTRSRTSSRSPAILTKDLDRAESTIKMLEAKLKADTKKLQNTVEEINKISGGSRKRKRRGRLTRRR